MLFFLGRIINHLWVHRTRQALRGMGPYISLCQMCFNPLQPVNLTLSVFRALWKVFPSCSGHMGPRLETMVMWWRHWFLQRVYSHWIQALLTHMTGLPYTRTMMAQTLKCELSGMVQTVSLLLLSKPVLACIQVLNTSDLEKHLAVDELC